MKTRAPLPPTDPVGRREADRKMILGEWLWPHGDRLPVKNPSRYADDDKRSMGVIYAGLPTVVNIHNVYDGEPGRVEIEQYADVDALLDAGWTVD